MTFYVYDATLYRLRHPGQHLERWQSAGWTWARGDIAPSQEEYLRMESITEAEAVTLIGPEAITAQPATIPSGGGSYSQGA